MILSTVNHVRPGDVVADEEKPEKRRKITKVDTKSCMHHVHLDSVCYDAGYPILIER